MASSLSGLPVEIISSNIVGFLNVVDRMQLSACCRSLAAAVATADLCLSSEEGDCISLDRSNPGKLSVRLARKTFNTDSLSGLLRLRKRFGKKIFAECLSFESDPSDPVVDDCIADFIQDCEANSISITFIGGNPCPKIRDFVLINSDKRFDMCLEGRILDEDMLRSFTKPAEIGFSKILPSSRLDIPLFLTLVERGHTLLNAPVTLTTSQQMHQALLHIANPAHSGQNVCFAIELAAFNEFKTQMSESTEWRRDEFDDYFTTWAYKAVRMRELPEKDDEEENVVNELRIDMFKVLSYFSKYCC